MKVFQDLYIRGGGEVLHIVEVLKNYLQTANKDWMWREDMAERIEKFNGVSKQTCCIASPKIEWDGKNLESMLWLYYGNGRVEVSNIVPVVERHLSVDEYNHVLNLFGKQVLEDFAKAHNFTIEMTPAEDTVDNYIGPDGMEKLQLFSDMANKSTGCTHPMDFNRWCDFLFSCLGKPYMSTDLLQDWLCGHGWTEDVANELTLKYEYSIQLLNRYANR